MKIEIPEKKKFVYEMIIPIRWGDMDALGHLNNASYFRFFETARVDWLQSIGGMSYPEGEGFVIVNAFSNFLRQLQYPGDVLMKLYVSDPRRATFENWFTMERTDQPGVINATGGATVMWVDIPAERAKSLPDWVRKLVED